MKMEQENVLLKELECLRDEVPPMPEDFHARWTSVIKEDAGMENSTRKARFGSGWKRMLSAAAALVFVVGGTLLTKDSIRDSANVSNRGMREYSGDYGGSYVITEEQEYEAASYDTAAGVMNDSIMPLIAEASVRGAENGAERESKIIRTASLSIATKNYAASLTALKALCEESGGWISWSSETESTSGLRRANITMRIPADKLDAFLEGSGSTGRLTGKTETMDDVTESYYDTAARLETQKALMARLQALVTDAADLSDILALEAQMADTQYQIDRLTNSLQSTDKRVNYATVDVNLREERASDDLTNQEMTLGERLVSALSTGWTAFTDFLGDAAVFMVAALPFIAVVAAAVAVAKIALLIRKRKG